MSQPPPVSRVLETCLYVRDLARARAFYDTLFAFPVLVDSGRFCAYDVGQQSVLLLFVQGESAAGVPVTEGWIPPHDSRGPAHIGFAIARGDLDRWDERLRDGKIAIESRITWPRGGISVYFRDPDDHLVELLTPGLWATY